MKFPVFEMMEVTVGTCMETHCREDMRLKNCVSATRSLVVWMCGWLLRVIAIFFNYNISEV